MKITRGIQKDHNFIKRPEGLGHAWCSKMHERWVSNICEGFELLPIVTIAEPDCFFYYRKHTFRKFDFGTFDCWRHMFLHNALELHLLYVLFWERFIFIFVKIYLYVHKLAPLLEFV